MIFASGNFRSVARVFFPDCCGVCEFRTALDTCRERNYSKTNYWMICDDFKREKKKGKSVWSEKPEILTRQNPPDGRGGNI